MMHVRVGDPIKVRVAPDVDQSLWGQEGFVAGFTDENRVIVELDDGADVTMNPDQIEHTPWVDTSAAFRGTTVRLF